MLFYSYIKPQQLPRSMLAPCSCMLFYSYIKPQHGHRVYYNLHSCMLFYSYIKPQHIRLKREPAKVVCYSIPTSNHNLIAPVMHHM